MDDPSSGKCKIRRRPSAGSGPVGACFEAAHAPCALVCLVPRWLDGRRRLCHRRSFETRMTSRMQVSFRCRTSPAHDV
jgi:hypothetical protein